MNQCDALIPTLCVIPKAEGQEPSMQIGVNFCNIISMHAYLLEMINYKMTV